MVDVRIGIMGEMIGEVNHRFFFIKNGANLDQAPTNELMVLQVKLIIEHCIFFYVKPWSKDLCACQTFL